MQGNCPYSPFRPGNKTEQVLPHAGQDLIRREFRFRKGDLHFSGMTANDDAHHFKVEYDETPGLPYQVSAPEQGASGGYRGIRFIVISADFVLHILHLL